jgi:hypothetical protein
MKLLIVVVSKKVKGHARGTKRKIFLSSREFE